MFEITLMESKDMKITFDWSHREYDKDSQTAKSLAELFNNREGNNRWSGRPFTRYGVVRETLGVEVKTLRGANLHHLCRMVDEHTPGHQVVIRIEGRRLIDYAIWAHDQVRKLQGKVSDLGVALTGTVIAYTKGRT
jgi:hypothetical protein